MMCNNMTMDIETLVDAKHWPCQVSFINPLTRVLVEGVLTDVVSTQRNLGPIYHTLVVEGKGHILTSLYYSVISCGPVIFDVEKESDSAEGSWNTLTKEIGQLISESEKIEKEVTTVRAEYQAVIAKRIAIGDELEKKRKELLKAFPTLIGKTDNA